MTYTNPLSAAPALPAQPTSLRRRECDVEIIIPSFNEERRLPTTLRAVLEVLAAVPTLRSRVVIVDNGSVDRTAEIADRLAASSETDVVVIGCSVGGKGAAVARGVATSSARFVGFTDADLSVPAQSILDAIAMLMDGDDVVIGSRRCVGATYEVNQPRFRRMGSWAFHAAISQLVPGISDSQCGFKFFSGPAAAAIFSELHTTGFAFDVELLMRALRLGYAVRELPVAWSDGADSTLRVGAHGLDIARSIARLHRLNASRTWTALAPASGQ